MAPSIILIMVPYVDVVSILIGRMIRGETHWMDVSFGEENSHIFCSTCSKGSMGYDMATTTKHLSLYVEGHEIDGMIWANMIHNVRGKIFGDLFFFLPLEGNIIAAQDQQKIYTYHRWKEENMG